MNGEVVAQQTERSVGSTKEAARWSSGSLAALAWRRFRRHHLGMPSVIVFSLITLLVVAAPLFSDDGPNALNVQHRLEGPSMRFWFGTDILGRDVFARVLHGGRVSLLVAVVGVLVTGAVGITLGVVSGYYGGRVDTLIQRLVEIVIAIPGLILIIVAVSVFGASIYITMVLLGLIGWGGLCRFVRGQLLALREEDYILAARCLGASDRRIMFHHVLPNVVPYVLVLLVLAFANFILIETGLSYLGLGVQQPTPSWGNLVGEASSIQNIEDRPWLWLPAGLAITFTVLSVNFAADALRDALDPRGSRH